VLRREKQPTSTLLRHHCLFHASPQLCEEHVEATASAFLIEKRDNNEKETTQSVLEATQAWVWTKTSAFGLQIIKKRRTRNHVPHSTPTM
jgi:hypothetical protein